MPSKEKLLDVAVLRCFAIICIVFSHSYSIMYSNHFPSLKNAYYSIYHTFVNCGLINIAMPMFVFISGYLFIFLIKKGKYPTFGNLIKNKFQRILLPYFVFGFFMMVTIKGYNPIDLLNGILHLWFLPMIFWCFVVTYLLRKLFLKLDFGYGFILLIILFAISLLPRIPINFLCIHCLPIWYCWFYMGICVFLYQKKVIKIFAKFKLVFLLTFVYLIIQFKYPTGYSYDCQFYRWYSLLSLCSGVLAIWYVAHSIHWETFRITKSLISFSNYSYGIYIFHYWILIYMVSRTAQRLLHLEYFAGEYMYLFSFTLFIVNLFVSYIVTKLTLKTKVGRYMIG